jgi:predicted DsbA family dithiol-disulfide isomerase
LSFELHPETPPNGILLSERFKGYDVSQMYDQLRTRGKEYGIVFGDRTLLSNSRKALEASEYARDMGKYESFHENIFYAYFTEALDIGSGEVISSVARNSSLDADDILSAIKDERYTSRLDAVREEAHSIDLTGVPTFIINGKYKIVGAQQAEVFRDLFRKINR